LVGSGPRASAEFAICPVAIKAAGDARWERHIESKLRGCDVIKVRIGDLVLGGQVRTRAMVIRAKTGKLVQLELIPMHAPASLEPGARARSELAHRKARRNNVHETRATIARALREAFLLRKPA
jgi:hypothetical protein